MNIPKKLQKIQRRLDVTQVELASRFGVSFAALNRWMNGRAEPRPAKKEAIDELYREVTGQRVVPEEVLQLKTESLQKRAEKHPNIIEEIITQRDIYDELMLTLTYNSNSIEGSTLSEPETKAVIFDNVTLSNKSLIEHMEAKNHQAALEYTFGHAQKSEHITEDFIRNLHGMLLNGIQSDAGRYRNHPVRIVSANVPTANHLKVPDLMKEIGDESGKVTDDPLHHIADIHSEFEKIHPFSDGNGRVGRLLIIRQLLAVGLAPAVIRSKKKQLYYTYLNKAQTKGDLSQLKDFLCDAISMGFDIVERKDVG